jgi:hypothetical protein
MAVAGQLWGDYDDEDEVYEVPSASVGVPKASGSSKPSGVSASVAPWAIPGSADADEFRQIAEQSREGFNLEFKQVSRASRHPVAFAFELALFNRCSQTLHEDLNQKGHAFQ